jgi:Tfp pilus assembly protein PilO
MNSDFFRRSSWIITVPLVAVAITYMALQWLPGHRDIETMQEQVESQRQFVEQSTDIQAALNAAQRELDKAESVTRKWEQAAMHERQMLVLYEKITGLAKQAGLTLAKFDPQCAVDYERIRELPISIRCSGRFSQVHEFLRGLERLHVTIWEKAVKLEKINANAKDIKCELELAVFSNNP